MFDGMDEEEAPKKKPEPVDGPLLTERDKMKLERRKRKDDHQREAQYLLHVAEMEAFKAGMPTVCVNHGDGPLVKDIHMENFNVSVGGRNGTEKTTFLRHMALHAIDGIPKNCQILHVEQEVVGDDTIALQCVLSSDVERAKLLEEETKLIALQVRNMEEENGKDKKKINRETDKNAISQRLEEIYKKLELIDSDTVESRAASILAGLSFSPEMQMKPTKAFSEGWRMRIALARALFIEPDILLLDEPTNHLDLHAVL